MEFKAIGRFFCFHFVETIDNGDGDGDGNLIVMWNEWWKIYIWTTFEVTDGLSMTTEARLTWDCNQVAISYNSYANQW